VGCWNIIIGKPHEYFDHMGISLTGLYICGVISLVMLVLKLSVIETWS
jgi:hypothetical protein